MKELQKGKGGVRATTETTSGADKTIPDATGTNSKATTIATPTKGGLFRVHKGKNQPMRKSEESTSTPEPEMQRSNKDGTSYPRLEFKELDLPSRSNPPKGYHYELGLMLPGMPREIMKTVADSGADGSTVSQDEVDEKVYKQKHLFDLGQLNFPRAITDFFYMERPQEFYGLLGSSGGKRTVNVCCTVRS